MYGTFNAKFCLTHCKTTIVGGGLVLRESDSKSKCRELVGFNPTGIGLCSCLEQDISTPQWWLHPNMKMAERLRALFLLKSLDHFTAVSGVGSCPALATCETSQVLLRVCQVFFSQGSPVFAHLLIGPSHMS